MNSEPTYIFKNGNVYTYLEGKIIASVPEEDFSEEDARHLASSDGATHVTTPNGLRGKILGKVKGLWEDEVTVRFENGRISSLPVSSLTFSSEEGAESTDGIKDLENRVEATLKSYEASDLKDRAIELEKIKLEAHDFIGSGLSDLDLARVGSVISQANYELNEIGEAAEAVTERLASGLKSPNPFKIEIVEQGGPTGGRSSNWLDGVLDELTHEANSTDYKKLMDEGPEAFVAGLDRNVLGDTGAVRLLASDFINEKTAAADQGIQEKYNKVWLARVEETRKAALASVKQDLHKQASKEEEVDYDSISDESLFM